jgi:hypothetical protein
MEEADKFSIFKIIDFFWGQPLYLSIILTHLGIWGTTNKTIPEEVRHGACTVRRHSSRIG